MQFKIVNKINGFNHISYGMAVLKIGITHSDYEKNVPNCIKNGPKHWKSVAANWSINDISHQPETWKENQCYVAKGAP